MSVHSKNYINMKKVLCTLLAFAVSLVISQPTFQNSSGTRLRVDNGTYGPPVEEVHYFYDQWPVGFAVSSKGRIFVTYYPGNYTYTLGEVVDKTTERPYPSQEWNVPPDERTQNVDGILFGSNNRTGLISVQALYITPQTDSRPETLWVLDVGRPNVGVTGEMAYALPGGTKLVAINLDNDTVTDVYTFPSTVNYPDSSLNDLRFDLRPNVTESGKGIVYFSDESPEGRNGIVMLDLGTGESWRQLDLHPSTRGAYDVVPSYQGVPFYQWAKGSPFKHLTQGCDGIQLDPSGSVLYYSPMVSDYIYSIETKYLRDHTSIDSLEAANDNVKNLGQRGGHGNGFEGDSNGLIYQGIPEQNAIYYYNPSTRRTEPFVRDPRIIWPDGLSVGEDGYLYVIINQLPYQPMWNNGTDLRQYPGTILRAKLPNGGTKITSLY
ncbi:major royal jelly protein [Paecilomyces variotii]|uniref:Major royal jelly protein n=1 Tax=Byssochlamys spectabilis TaxID=264951 RepID=A0A443HHG1_BYSSP|nr:major royal jelly protein [Paecilomyces variotii]RWQ91272.1 major royal jelly protein [Paecilomyces variotii]